MLELITTLVTGPAKAASRPSSRCPLSWMLVAVALLLGASAAQATPIWSAGDLTTYGMFDWSDDPTAESLLTDNYNTVYASSFDVVEIGIPGTAGYSAQFTDSSYILDYLPAVGPSGALDTDLSNPTQTSSGAFGGVVLALRLNIDYSDAGVLPANSSVPFGDLVLTNYSAVPSLNGLTVRNISALANTLLGGGSNGYTIDSLGVLIEDLNNAFSGGVPETFAQDYLVAPNGSTTSVPEPSTLALFGIGLLGLVGIGTKRRRVFRRLCPSPS